MPHWTTPERTFERVDEALREEEYFALADTLRETLDELRAEGRLAAAGSTAPPAVPIKAVHVATEFDARGRRCFVVDVETVTGWRRVWSEVTDHDGEISAFIEALGIAKAPEVDLSGRGEAGAP
jgi:hypothetical protein